jgi:DNA-binding transcriptional LysR family regulator
MEIDAMNLANLDLNLLVALEALLVEESVGRAARRVGLSQPAMSHALNRLRGLLGDPLLVRVGARMQPTLRAEAMREPLREALEKVRGVLRTEAFDPRTSERTFRVLMSDYASGVVLAPLLLRLRREAPLVKVEVCPWHGRRGDLLEAARAADAALTCETELPGGFHRQRLYTDRDAIAVRRGHPRLKALSAVDEFLAADHVAVVEREFSEDPVDAWLRGEGRTRRIALEVPHYVQALHLVARTDLVAVIPERLIRAYAAALSLRALPVPIDAGTFDEHLLHPTRTHADSGCAWFRGVLREVAASLGELPATASARRRSPRAAGRPRPPRARAAGARRLPSPRP